MRSKNWSKRVAALHCPACIAGIPVRDPSHVHALIEKAVKYYIERIEVAEECSPKARRREAPVAICFSRPGEKEKRRSFSGPDAAKSYMSYLKAQGYSVKVIGGSLT